MNIEVAQNKQKWLIIFLIYADFTDTARPDDANIILGLENMYKDIITTPIDPDSCRLFMFMDNSSYIKEDGWYIKNTIDRYEIGRSNVDNLNEIKSRVALFESMQMLNQSGDNTISRHNFQSAKPLEKILKTVEINPDEEVLFITWDHGAGFGIFRNDVAESRVGSGATKPPSPAALNLNSNIFLREFLMCPISARMPEDFLRYEETNQELEIPDILDNSELADALSFWLTAYNKKHVGVLLMMNCWMMNLHTIYALKNVVSCLVAPQTEIGNPGYNYQAIIKYINSTNEERITAQKLATTCVTSRLTPEFRNKVTILGLNDKKIIDDCIIIPMNLQMMLSDDPKIRVVDKLFKLLSEVIEKLHQEMINEFNNTLNIQRSVTHLLRYTRPAAFDFTGSIIHLIDINSYFKLLTRIDTSLSHPPKNAEAMSSIIKFVNSAMDEKLILPGVNLYKPYYVEEVTDYILLKPMGFSMFFRRFKESRLNKKVRYNIGRDNLLNDMAKWQKIIEMAIDKIP